jgi:hypothetical protein
LARLGPSCLSCGRPSWLVGSHSTPWKVIQNKSTHYN